MRRLAIVAAIAALLAMAVPAETLGATGTVGTCTNGTMAGGTYSSFVVRGSCTIAFGVNVHIRGNLIVAPGAMLNDHGAEQWMHAEMHVSGNILVGHGAVLGFGWNSPNGEGSLGPDTVGGSIVADRPMALQIGEATIHGNLISVGGGVASTSMADFRNFPVKDNVVGGNLVVVGWHGGWIGLVRNTVGRNVVFSYNVSMSNPETGPGTDPDSSEVMGTHIDMGGGVVIDIPQTVGGNLICLGNVPAAQVNPLDGGAPSTVAGHAIGQCASISK